MSRTTVISVDPGVGHADIEELRNSWGSAPLVWDALAGRYLGQPNAMMLILFGGSMDPLWRLVEDKRVSLDARACLALTFDGWYVLKQDFQRMANHIRAFLKEFPPREERVNHWPRIAEIFETSDAPAIGLHCTSVSENPFENGEWNEETEERGPIDWSKLYSLFDEIGREETASI